MFSYIVADWREKVNRRLKKKIDKRKRDKIHRILDLVFDINGMEERKRDITGDKPTAFLYFYGHTTELEVSVHSEGWDSDDYPNFRVAAYPDGRRGLSMDKLIADLEKKAVELNV